MWKWANRELEEAVYQLPIYRRSARIHAWSLACQTGAEETLEPVLQGPCELGPGGLGEACGQSFTLDPGNQLLCLLMSHPEPLGELKGLSGLFLCPGQSQALEPERPGFKSHLHSKGCDLRHVSALLGALFLHPE